MTPDDRTTWYYLEITTGDREGADADGTVGVWVRDRAGRCTVEQVLGGVFYDDLSHGSTNRAFVRTPPGFCEPADVVLRLRTARHWLVHEIRMVNRSCRTWYGTGPQDVWLIEDGDCRSTGVAIPLKERDVAQASREQQTSAVTPGTIKPQTLR